MSEALVREAKDQLLAEAAKKAKENASILAEAAGGKAGKVVYIHNYYSCKTFNDARMMKALLNRANDIVEDHIILEEESPLQISSQEISIAVTCKFLLE